jgi:hypothetical protein
METEELKAKYAAMGPLFRPSDFLTTEPNMAATFFVLCEENDRAGFGN